ncbi:uncharacterized protein LOC123526385 [Mercenaria mercenaria]|uniref:uncharacterized protein LOC123526385 n=1 Tax=Mercenaria mercenaria TaxID=6596 RepID=UPI00234ECD33|nr:uncharacterized protein LOC123526385 [Mercenaria mercenaria]
MWLLALLSLCMVNAFTIRDNVLFMKTNQVTLTRNTWKLAFTLDLTPYDSFVTRITDDIKLVEVIAKQTLQEYDDEPHSSFRQVFLNLEKEIKHLKDMQTTLSSKFNRNKVTKRALLPFLGNVLSWLTGTSTEDQVNAVRKNVAHLAKTQQAILHVVEESLTVLNVTKTGVQENRNTINDIISALDSIDRNLSNLRDRVHKELTVLTNFVQTYFYLNGIIQNLKELISRGFVLYEHLEIQLDAVALSHLSPGVIEPFQLKAILRSVRSSLPPMLKLPFNEQHELWQYYQNTQCSAIFVDNQIIIVAFLPILEMYEKFDVYRLINMPIALFNNSIQETDTHTVLAQYQLEGKGLAINTQRTKYAILTEHELKQCSNKHLGYCNVRSALYTVGLSTKCIIHLYLQREEKIEKFCQKVVLPNVHLPSAMYISDGLWLITSQKSLRLALTCFENKSITTKSMVAHAPLDALKLPMGCVANGDYLSLTAYYFKESNYQITDNFVDILRSNINISSSKLWSDFYAATSKLHQLRNPPQVKIITANKYA